MFWEIFYHKNIYNACIILQFQVELNKICFILAYKIRDWYTGLDISHWLWIETQSQDPPSSTSS